jgi:hypothetical protein
LVALPLFARSGCSEEAALERVESGANIMELTVIGGVDTHKDVHVAAALDHLRRLPGADEIPTRVAGYRSLLVCLVGFGQVDRVGAAALAA